jgi:hypothetical protein
MGGTNGSLEITEALPGNNQAMGD